MISACGRTRLEFPSTHHSLLFAECFSSPAFVATTVLFRESLDVWRSPGPSLRFTCCAGTDSPGRTCDMAEEERKTGDGREPRAARTYCSEHGLGCLILYYDNGYGTAARFPRAGPSDVGSNTLRLQGYGLTIFIGEKTSRIFSLTRPIFRPYFTRSRGSRLCIKARQSLEWPMNQ
jgi:hypothetical protein